MSIRFTFAVLTCLLLTNACVSIKEGKKYSAHYDATTYLQWYESPRYPYRDTVRSGEVTYICTFEPRQVEIARQYTNELINKESAISYLKDEEDLLQFRMQIFLPQAGTDVLHYQLKEGENVSSRTSYFAFAIKEDLKISYGLSDTSDCSSVHFERGIANFPVSRLLIYFPYKKEKIKSIVFNPAVFGHPEVLFEFNNLLITNLPKLKL